MSHIMIPAPTDCFELTVFPESECWDFSRDGIITYDEADYMASGITLYEARQYIAQSECACEMCNA